MSDKRKPTRTVVNLKSQEELRLEVQAEIQLKSFKGSTISTEKYAKNEQEKLVLKKAKKEYNKSMLSQVEGFTKRKGHFTHKITVW